MFDPERVEYLADIPTTIRFGMRSSLVGLDRPDEIR